MYSFNLFFEKYIKYYLIKGKFNRCSKEIDLGNLKKKFFMENENSK